jgi:hypothetical protein
MGFASNTLRCEGRTHRRIARDRERARGECLWSPGLLGGLAGGRVRSRNSRGIPKKKSCSLNSVTPVLEYLLYVIQRQGRSVPKHVLHPCRSKIDFLYNSQKQYKNQYNLNFLFARQNSPREVQKKLCRTSAAKRCVGSKVVARLRWF